MRKNRLIIWIVCLAILIPASVIAWKSYIGIAPARAVDTYVCDLVAGDQKEALSKSSGPASFDSNKATVIGASVVKLNVEIIDMGSGWAEALAYIELALQDGSHDAGWYQADLVWTNNSWKVISLSGAQPRASGLRWFNSKQDLAAASNVFTSYIQLLTQNRYQSAAKLLAGDARVAHESDAPALGKARLFKYAGSIHLTSLWRRGNQMVCRADYRIDGRAISAIVRFIRLGDGWHIMGLDQV
jgi:hypothetical protein